MNIYRILVIAIVTLSTTAAVPAFSQTGAFRNGTNNQNSATAQAGKAVHKAQVDYDKVEADLNRSRARVRASILAKPEWAAVIAAKKEAGAALEIAKRSALVPLKKREDYQRLSKEREDARTLMSSEGATAPQSADTFVKDGFAMKEMENAVLRDDSRIQESTRQLEAVDAKLREVDNQVNLALKDDPDFQNAEKLEEPAKTALATARQQLGQAAQQERQAREAAARARQNSGTRGR